MQEQDTKYNEYVPSDSEVLASIGEAYYTGFGLEKDYTQAFHYYQKAADMGNVPALRRLGMCYELGHGTKRNIKAAFDCYETASDAGDAGALIRMGDFYWNGKKNLVEKDRQKAADYYFLALRLVNQYQDLWEAPEAYLRVADCLFEGIGTNVDYQKACTCYENAADGFYGRIENGDFEVEKLLDRSEKGIEQCHKKLGIVPSKNDEQVFN